MLAKGGSIFSGLHVTWLPVHRCILHGLYSSFTRLASGQAQGLLCTQGSAYSSSHHFSALFSLIIPPALQPARVQDSWGEESRMVGADLFALCAVTGLGHSRILNSCHFLNWLQITSVISLSVRS